MAEHLRKRNPRETIKRVGRIIGGFAIACSVVGGLEVGGEDIYHHEISSKNAILPLKKDTSLANCNDIVSDDLGGVKGPATALDQLESIDKKTNKDGCEFAFVIGKQTVNLYRKHPNLFTEPYDEGGELDVALKVPKVGVYDEIDYATTPNGSPIYSRVEDVMVGYNNGNQYWAISIDSSEPGGTYKSGTSWDTSASSSSHYSTIQNGFDSTELYGTLTDSKLEIVGSETVKLGLYMYNQQNHLHNSVVPLNS